MDELLAFIAMVVTLVIGVIVGKKKWDKGYTVFNNLVCVIDEFEDLASKVSASLLDKKVTKEELKEILEEVQEFIEAVRQLVE